MTALVIGSMKDEWASGTGNWKSTLICLESSNRVMLKQKPVHREAGLKPKGEDEWSHLDNLKSKWPARKTILYLHYVPRKPDAGLPPQPQIVMFVLFEIYPCCCRALKFIILGSTGNPLVTIAPLINSDLKYDQES